MWLNDESAGLLLEHGNNVHRLNVGVVLRHFLGRYGALVTLFGERIDARLYSRVSAQLDHAFCYLWGEAVCHRIKYLCEACGCVVHRSRHICLLLMYVSFRLSQQTMTGPGSCSFGAAMEQGQRPLSLCRCGVQKTM